MASRKISLKDAADSKLVKELTHQDNRKAVIGGAVALGLVAVGLAALFLTPQGKTARTQVAQKAAQGYHKGKEVAGHALQSASDRVPALASLIPVKHNGHTQEASVTGYSY